MTAYQNPFMNQYGMYQNPYQVQQTPQFQPSTQVVRVNGENGARAFQIGANSSALLLDETGVMVWLVTSDGAGYKTVSAYDITPHKISPTQDYLTLETRISKLEEMMNGDSTNTSAVKRKISKPIGTDSPTD